MSDEYPELVQIRCPKKRYFRDYQKIMVCNRLCAEVYPGSGGRAFCNSCRTHGNVSGDKGIDPYFRYEVDANYQIPRDEIKHIKTRH